MEARKIPTERNSLTVMVSMRNEGFTEEQYVESMIRLEKQIEKSLISMLRELDVNASVKTDRYSLPYNHEIKHTGYGESYLNAAFESAPLKRKIVKEILDKGLYKIRFYIFAEIEDQFPMGKVNYYFRYYVHENK